MDMGVISEEIYFFKQCIFVCGKILNCTVKNIKLISPRKKRQFRLMHLLKYVINYYPSL